MKKTFLSILVAATLSGCGTAELASTATPLPSTGINTQVTCTDAQHQQANDLRIYQIMVESFVSGEANRGHGTGYGTSHHMGDLQGIIDSLDYISDLGMNAIWLTPIFESIPVEGQAHWADRLDATGYFASDYFAIDPRFGTLEQARELVDKAHEKGLYVFFDGVFGHHKGNVKPSPSGLLPEGGSNPVTFPQSTDFYKEVATYWIDELKIDGWRLDQAYQVPTDAWAEIRQAVEETSQQVSYIDKNGDTVNPMGYMVAEIWNNENYIIETGYGSEQSPALCSAFDFPMRYRVIETFAVNESGVGNRGGEWLAEGMDLHNLYPEHATPNLMLGNHDTVRLGNLIQRGGLAAPESPEYWQRLKGAYSFLAAYPGPVTLYYGEEIGDKTADFAEKWDNDNCAIQGYCDDHVARTSAKIDGISVTLDQAQSEFKDYVSQLMHLRQSHPALSKGERNTVLATSDVYVDHKQAGDDVLVYATSTTSTTKTLTLSGGQIGSAGTLTDLLSGETFSPDNGQYQLPLSPFQPRYLVVNEPGKLVLGKGQQAAALTGTGFMASCDNPTVSEGLPIQSPLYVVGDFADAGWKHKAHRSFTYKGDNTFQAVINEKAGAYKMQFASSDWSQQFTTDGLSLKPATDGTLIKGGYGQDTAVTLPESGKYVWSLKFDDQGSPRQIMVSKCAG